MARRSFRADCKGVTTMPSEDLTDIAELASRLLRHKGIEFVEKIEPVTGGRNNRAFRVKGSTCSWLLNQGNACLRCGMRVP